MHYLLSWVDRNFWSSDRIKITALYVFMLAGGLWHILDVLQEVMRLLASATMAAVSLWIIYELRILENIKLLILWLCIVFGLSIFVENIGVITGSVFGNYTYGPTLTPFIGHVPLAIGFAWINMLLTSAAVAQMILNIQIRNHKAAIILAIAFLMVIFDIIMEPAAGRLNYWTWDGGRIPIQNYVAWFVLAVFFAFLGTRLKILTQKLPSVICHAYFAQLGYFTLVNLK